MRGFSLTSTALTEGRLTFSEGKWYNGPAMQTTSYVDYAFQQTAERVFGGCHYGGFTLNIDAIAISPYQDGYCLILNAREPYQRGVGLQTQLVVRRDYPAFYPIHEVALTYIEILCHEMKEMIDLWNNKRVKAMVALGGYGAFNKLWENRKSHG